MKSFMEFCEAKRAEPFASYLVSRNINAQQFCAIALEHAKELNPRDPEALNELFRGLGNLFGAGKQAVSNAATAAAQKVSDVGAAAGRGVMQAGQYVADKASQAGQYVADKAGQAVDAAKQGVIKAGQTVGDIYQQGEHMGKLQDAKDAVGKLQTQLSQLDLSALHPRARSSARQTGWRP
jgi:hypothetical protein